MGDLKQESGGQWHAAPNLGLELIDNNAVDFGDQLSLAVALLQQLPFVCEEYNRKFAGVLVDEFQAAQIHGATLPVSQRSIHGA
eukprot:1156351-Pelagomonas_calceolata.AAC.16